MTPSHLKNTVQQLSNPEKAATQARYFKTGKGEYGEGDIFSGLTVPQSRKIDKEYKDLDLDGISKLLSSPIHAERLIALLILVEQYRKAAKANKKAIVDFYLKHRMHINNWDLVDSSAPYILLIFNRTKRQINPLLLLLST